MSEMTLDQEILAEVQKLDAVTKRHILDIVRGFSQTGNRVRGEPGWLFLERTRDIRIEPEDLKRMEQIIEDVCEQIDDFPEVHFDE